MKINRLWSIGLAFLLVSSAIAEGNKFWIDLESPDTQTLHYGAIPTSAVQGDLDNDGIMDVVVGTDDSPAGYWGKCFILWGGTDYQELLNIVAETTVIAIEDLDNNGYKDIICRERTFYNQGNRTFSRAEDEGYPPAAKFADLNGDGILDLSTGGYWENRSDGARQDLNIRADYFEIIDMNNDGRLDIVCNRRDEPYLYYWHDNIGGEQLFLDAQNLNPVFGLRGKYDIDYDGDDDLIVRRDGIMGMLENDNGLLSPKFTPMFDVMPDGFYPQFSIIDIDFDGDWDLFGYNYDEKRFFVVEQIGYRTLQFEFHWISDKVSLPYWSGSFLYQNDGKTYYYFRVLSYIGVGAKGGVYRTPINVQAENAVSMNWELFQ